MQRIKEYAIVTIATFILAVAFNTTVLPLEIVIGGSSGLSIIGQHFFGISPALIIFLCYLGALIFGFIFLGKDKIKKSVFGTILYPFWVYITSPLCAYIKTFTLNPSEVLILVIMGAIVSGIAYGMVYKIEYTTGGSDIASQIINKYFGITIGTSNLIINAVIVIAGGAIFGWTKVLYAILTLYVIGLATDKILLGISYSKSFYIITDKVDEVKNYIHNDMNQKVTELDAVGGYTNKGNKVLMCVVPTREYFKLREGINIIDEDAFFVIMDAYELESRI
ncbi:MAG: YitT family protein [Bacilli bacterium]|nr:YitT family protein [Bacilli bacterium]MDD3305162.1 YitT family protein [Bacilli bacterium]MDD4053987.1 YitT family protein [Bacilli bacterium]MDD4411732.1 YitT family protein [Bacilli bacterium]